MKKHIWLLWLCCAVLPAIAQPYKHIVPEPWRVQPIGSDFSLSAQTPLFADAGAEKAVAFLQDYLRQFYGWTCRSNPTVKRKNKIPALYVRISPQSNDEAYDMRVTTDSLVISGRPAGLFYGIQTLIQLLPQQGRALSIPGVLIHDQPRFPYRGLHLDVGRHFFPVAFIKRYLDMMALHKLNRFHWHLTEDQGWRIEIRRFPELTRRGSIRNQTLQGAYGSGRYDGKPYGGYYTQEQIRDIVAYAAARHIEVIPEIEMPGHCRAALHAYPRLGCTGGPYEVMETWGVSEDVMCAGKDSTFMFLEQVLDEVLALFPSRLIHIGGDECPKGRWKKCPSCQQRIQVQGLKNEEELQSYFIRRISQYLSGQGRTLIGWDEILEGGLADGAAVMSWRGEEGGIAAARQHHPVVMTPGKPLYFDHSQSRQEDSLTQGGYNSLKDVYDYDPIPSVLNREESAYILGAQANVWTEYMTQPNKVWYMLLPRLSALSETQWASRENKDWGRFQQKIPRLLERYRQWDLPYSKAYYEVDVQLQATGTGLQLALSCTDTAGQLRYRHIGDGTDSIYRSAIDVNKAGIWLAYLKGLREDTLSPVWRQDFLLHQAAGRRVKWAHPPNRQYPGSGEVTLVDGILNQRGMQRSSQFVGFWGNDLNATLDLGRLTAVDSITLRCFEQTGSWIHRPSSVSFFHSTDGQQFEFLGSVREGTGTSHLLYTLSRPLKTKYIKIIAVRHGVISDGFPGAGHEAWLFADEIVVD